jgi:hypothetical protein
MATQGQQAAPAPAPVPVAEAPSAPPAQHASPAPQGKPEAYPTRARVQEAREQWTMLNSRATGIRTSLDSIQRSQAAGGLNMNSRLQQPAHLMDSYLQGANDALNAGDVSAANDFMKKAERQIEILEKLLNR